MQVNISSCRECKFYRINWILTTEDILGPVKEIKVCEICLRRVDLIEGIPSFCPRYYMRFLEEEEDDSTIEDR